MSTIAFDLDDTLCEVPRDAKPGPGIKKYLSSRPIPDKIAVVNELHARGHEILIYTARGMLFLAKDRDAIIDELYELTKGQLREWGIKHHRLIMGKPFYDLLVDDKAMDAADFDSVESIERTLRKNGSGHNA